MAHNRKQTNHYNGIAISLQPDMDPGLAMLIAQNYCNMQSRQLSLITCRMTPQASSSGGASASSGKN